MSNNYQSLDNYGIQEPLQSKKKQCCCITLVLVALGIVVFLLVTPAISIPISLVVLTDHSYTIYPSNVGSHGILLPANRPSNGNKYKGVRVTNPCKEYSGLVKVVVTPFLHTKQINEPIDEDVTAFKKFYTVDNFTFNAQVNTSQSFQLVVDRMDIENNISTICNNTYPVDDNEVSIECNSTGAGYYYSYYVSNDASGQVEGNLIYEVIDINEYENCTSCCTITSAETSCNVPIKFTDNSHNIIVIFDRSRRTDCLSTVTYEANYAIPNAIISAGSFSITGTVIACIGCICCYAVCCCRKKKVIMYGVSVEETGN